MAWMRVKLEVAVLWPESLAQSSGVTCLATSEWVDLILGKSDMVAGVG